MAQTATEVILHNFGRLEGAEANSAPVLDAAGNLYGATEKGGINGYGGSVYKLDTSGHYTVLHSFTGGTDGAIRMASWSIPPVTCTGQQRAEGTHPAL
jgi:uncharacterized repeat protein (TIGR03803 family)